MMQQKDTHTKERNGGREGGRESKGCGKNEGRWKGRGEEGRGEDGWKAVTNHVIYTGILIRFK